MSIEIFVDVTTESALSMLEEESKKYVGLYVDMDDAPQRKYVKDSAQTIVGLLKALDRARIDKVRAFKLNVESEASAIKQRLEDANSPFTLLIDEHKKKRAEILAEEKRIEEAKQLSLQIEHDHEYAILVDAKVMADKAAAELERITYENDLKEKAAAQAIFDLKAKQAQEGLFKDKEEKARLANVEHLRSVNSGILQELIKLGLDEESGKSVIKAVANKKIPNLNIRY